MFHGLHIVHIEEWFFSISVALEWSSTEIGNWLWRKKWWEELFVDSGHNNVSVLMVIKAVIHESEVFCENCDNNTDQHCALSNQYRTVHCYKVAKIGILLLALDNQQTIAR